jgi:DNA polymerase III epsilon subunit-like protein
MPLHTQRLADTPVTILDFETTGLSPKMGARVIEVAAVRIELNAAPVLVMDTLVDPEGPVYASEIHGIYDDDVIGAPRFADLAGDLAYALRDGPVAAFNASFDLSFLNEEYKRHLGGALAEPPYVCLMYLRPLLGLGKRCSLSVACDTLGIDAPSHRAADDALAAAHLWLVYRDAAIKAGISTYDQLRAAGKFKFLSSFDNPQIGEPLQRFGRRPCSTAPKPRFEPLSFSSPTALPQLTAEIDPKKAPKAPRAKALATRRRQYWQALQESLTDGLIDGAELRELTAQQRALSLAREDIQAVHIRVAAERIMLCAEDNKVTLREAAQLKDLFWVLRELGWAPGDAS